MASLVLADGFEKLPDQIIDHTAFAAVYSPVYTSHLNSWLYVAALNTIVLVRVKDLVKYKHFGETLITRLTTQRWLDVGPDWTEDEHQSAQSVMRYEYRVTCDAHYYGAGCASLCRPRDDSFGHYNCSLQGERKCLAGWQGDYCTKLALITEAAGPEARVTPWQLLDEVITAHAPQGTRQQLCDSMTLWRGVTYSQHMYAGFETTIHGNKLNNGLPPRGAAVQHPSPSSRHSFLFLGVYQGVTSSMVIAVGLTSASPFDATVKYRLETGRSDLMYAYRSHDHLEDTWSRPNQRVKDRRRGSRYVELIQVWTRLNAVVRGALQSIPGATGGSGVRSNLYLVLQGGVGCAPIYTWFYRGEWVALQSIPGATGGSGLRSNLYLVLQGGVGCAPIYTWCYRGEWVGRYGGGGGFPLSFLSDNRRLTLLESAWVSSPILEQVYIVLNGTGTQEQDVSVFARKEDKKKERRVILTPILSRLGTSWLHCFCPGVCRWQVVRVLKMASSQGGCNLVPSFLPSSVPVQPKQTTLSFSWQQPALCRGNGTSTVHLAFLAGFQTSGPGIELFSVYHLETCIGISSCPE
uniref:Delta-like protein n=1 Tax=Timema shepardi TaxID=629360 RepID=A0A7R9FWU0_TIMSH|nr:unnamed protein product [Timema shepardi]